VYHWRVNYETAFDAVVEKTTRTALAAALSETPQTISNWRVRGIPPNRCKAVEALTGVSVKVLRPNDWADYWPD
jgi:DNA-binding transcriptional regulator YdaS (Cro superfamily)